MKRQDVFANINCELCEIGKSRDLNSMPNLDNLINEIIDTLNRSRNSNTKFSGIEQVDALVRISALSVNALEHYGC